MLCQRCLRHNGLLIRGLCRDCDPQLHAEHKSDLENMGKLEDLFKRATGKSALEDWDGFERFVETQSRNA